ncbi:MAG TPA: hypothetical protein VID04_08225 [Methylomirabilota bacterium]|jgi:hypothetical protein
MKLSKNVSKLIARERVCRVATADSVIVEVTPKHVFSWGLD